MTSSSVNVSIRAQTAPIAISSFASDLDTFATIDTASFNARTLGGTTALMHFIHGGGGRDDVEDDCCCCCVLVVNDSLASQLSSSPSSIRRLTPIVDSISDEDDVGEDDDKHKTVG